MKRLLTLESGATSFFDDIVGADRYLDAKRPEADISGIETDDRTGRIRIRLTRPDGTFSNVLAMTLGAPVPGDTPFRNLSSDPPPGRGRIQDHRVGAQPALRPHAQPALRGPGDPRRPGGAPGLHHHGDREEPGAPGAGRDPRRPRLHAGRAAGRREAGGAHPVPDRYRETPSASTYYFFMNTRVPPFDDPKVREAVNYGIDKRALVRLFAGELTPGCSFIPPSVPGYDRGLDREDCPWGDPTAPPDLERARRLIGEAGARGKKVTVWGNSDNPTDKVTLAYADMLNKIGLEAKPRIVDGAVYFQVVGNQRTRAQTGFNNWFQDFPHPKDFFFLVDGRSIQPTNNPNPGNVADPEIDRGIAALDRRPRLTDAVTDRWEALNRTLVERGWVAPYGHRDHAHVPVRAHELRGLRRGAPRLRERLLPPLAQVAQRAGARLTRVRKRFVRAPCVYSCALLPGPSVSVSVSRPDGSALAPRCGAGGRRRSGR